jgi:hypothetical protein
MTSAGAKVIPLGMTRAAWCLRSGWQNDAALVPESPAPGREAITGLMLAGRRHDGRGLSGAQDQVSTFAMAKIKT